MSRLGSFIEGVDRADVAERVDQGIGSSPFTRWLKSKLIILTLIILRMGAVFMQNYLDYYSTLIPSTKFSSRFVR